MIDIVDHGEVRELRMNRPPANALSPEFVTELLRAVEAAPQQEARAIVLSGTPGMFSAGLDVPLLLTLDRSLMTTFWREFYTFMSALAASPIPIAAAITGHAPAGGTVLALFCDWRIAAEGDWKIGLNEVQVGLTLPPVIYCALHRLVGTRHAQSLAVRGLLIAPAQAATLGLVDEVVPADQVVSRAVDWCEGLVKLPRTAMEFTRRKARADLVGYFQHGTEREIEEVSASWWDEETQTALRQMVNRLAKKKV